MIIFIIESLGLELYITTLNLSFPKFPHQVMNEAGNLKMQRHHVPNYLKILKQTHHLIIH